MVTVQPSRVLRADSDSAHGRPSLVSIVAIALSLSLMRGDPQVSQRSWIRWFYTEIARWIVLSDSEWTRLQRKDKGIGKGAGDEAKGVVGMDERIAKLTVPEVRGLLVRIGSPLPSASDRSDDSRAFVASDASSLESGSYIPLRHGPPRQPWKAKFSWMGVFINSRLIFHGDSMPG